MCPLSCQPLRGLSQLQCHLLQVAQMQWQICWEGTKFWLSWPILEQMWRAILYPGAPMQSPESDVGPHHSSPCPSDPYWFVSLFSSHSGEVPGHSLINILVCKISGFLFPGNPICHILSIKLWFSASHLLWCHNSRISLSLSSLQPHGPSFDNAGSPQLLFPLCVKPPLPYPSGPA